MQNSLRELLHDSSVPDEVRAALENEFDELRALLKKIEQEEIHIVVFGRVSVGKSSLLNALMGENHFAVSPLHGETKQKQQQEWQDRPLAEHQTGGVHFIDTPGIDEVDGDTREWIARKAAQRADIILFVVDSDLTQTEFQALQSLKQFSQPMLLILNKADQYSEQEQTRLLKHLKQRVQGLVDPEHVLATSARSVEKKILLEQADGSYLEQEKILTPEVNELKDHIWHIVEHEGRTLAALNASLFASDLSDDVGKQVLTLRRELANKVITNYSLSKGLAVAANPIPIADLVAAAGLDVSMIIHLSRLHGLPMTREEAGDLFKVIITQLAALMGSTWAINALSTALKVTTAGLSTVLTAAAQGSIAYYATVVLGRVAETWLAQGKSWGKQGPKVVVKHILNNLDKKSILQEGRQAILEKLSRG
ncbi:MAG: DUF697 domain-containing protein [Gammaproteobacteria bacterium]|nr:DUF697 domain-containing protein [Gammaproteobacteria bacterium]